MKPPTNEMIAPQRRSPEDIGADNELLGEDFPIQANPGWWIVATVFIAYSAGLLWLGYRLGSGGF
jgi:hypothetical protein